MTETGDHSGITGVVLVGGKSHRMGADKVLLPVKGIPLVKSVLTRMSTVFSEVLVVGHHRDGFDALNITAIPDLLPDCGILGGIYTGLSIAETPYIFAVGSDMPFLDTGLIRRIASYRSGADAVIPKGPRGMEPLFAVYSRTCLDTMRRSLDEGRFRVLEALGNLDVLFPEILPPQGTDPDPFINLNTPEDLEKLE